MQVISFPTNISEFLFNGSYKLSFRKLIISMKFSGSIIQSDLDISKSKLYSKLLISQSKFSGTRKFTLRYQ